ncbi:MAG: WhiB family transcriptional regulator [Acidimicrobiales bacterium]
MTTLMAVEEDWRDLALCRDTSPDLFFPVGVTGPAIDQIAAAKQICDTCNAKIPCLEFAILMRQDTGVWGGTSEEERHSIRRQRTQGQLNLRLA